MNLRAGIIAAVGWGIFAGLVALVFIAAAEAVDFWDDLTVYRIYDPWLAYSLSHGFYSVIGAAAVFASAAWATYAPPGRHRLVTSAWWCFVGSIMTWMLISIASGPRLKGTPDPGIVRDLLFLIVPPVACSVGLTVLHGWERRQTLAEANHERGT